MENSAGLFLQREEKKHLIRLTSVNVKGTVLGCVAEVNVTQTFVNHHSFPGQGLYVFPLDNKGAVTSFQAKFDGKELHAELKEKEKAKQIYDRAVKKGQFASLLREELGDVFSIQMGNIPSQAEIEVHSFLCDRALSFQCERNPILTSHHCGASIQSNRIHSS